MTGHIVSSYDTELQSLQTKVVEMGAIAEKMMGDAIKALEQRDMTRARRIITSDQRLDLLQHAIEEEALRMLVRRAPVAVDLRDTISAIRISGDIERIGDLAKNIAKRVLAIDEDSKAAAAVVSIASMSNLVVEQLTDVIGAYADRNVEAALSVWRRDNSVDELYTAVFRELLTYMMEDASNITFCAHLLFCAKNIERIGDHTTNIAETVYFLATGEPLTEERPKGNTVPTASGRGA